MVAIEAKFKDILKIYIWNL